MNGEWRKSMSSLTPQVESYLNPLHEHSNLSTFTSTARYPQNCYHSPNNHLSPDIEELRHPNRVRGFSSIRDLAQASRHIVRKVSFTKDKKGPVLHNAEPTNPRLYPNLDTCKPPEDLNLSQPNDFSLDYLTPDQSGLSSDSSHPTTPSPGPYLPLRGSTNDQSMGNKTSKPSPSGESTEDQSKANKPSKSFTLRKKLPFRRSGDKDQKDPEEKREENQGQESRCPSAEAPQQLDAGTRPPDSSPKLTAQAIPVTGPSAPHNRSSSVPPTIPRRRSSLSAINYDRSQFDIPPSHQLIYRASTHSLTIRPTRSSQRTVTPSGQSEPNRRDTLSSPTILSPPLSDTRTPSNLSSVGPSRPLSLAHSGESPTPAPGPSRIYFPSTFPEGGPATTPAPQLTRAHYKCYRGHEIMSSALYKYHPIPCMTCGGDQRQNGWWCTYCELRICGSCMNELTRRGKDLTKLAALVKRGGGGRIESGAGPGMSRGSAMRGGRGNKMGRGGDMGRGRGSYIGQERGNDLGRGEGNYMGGGRSNSPDRGTEMERRSSGRQAGRGKGIDMGTGDGTHTGRGRGYSPSRGSDVDRGSWGRQGARGRGFGIGREKEREQGT